MLREALEPELVDSGVSIDDAQWSRLQTLMDLWRRYARAMNLTGAGSDAELVEHVQDGIATVLCARQATGLEHPGPWIDVGSGGGFPGLVVAALVDTPLLLIEPRAKRAAFLELAVRAICREDVGVERARIERSTWNKRSVGREINGTRTSFRIATARAVFGPAQWLETGINLVEEGGHVLVHVVEGGEEAIDEVPEHTEASRKGRVLAFRASPARKERFTWNLGR
jgi:16S rRNA (guanine527-N7)-methyltransferase